jgi:hypothetical protein
MVAAAQWASAEPIEAKKIYFKPIRIDNKRVEPCNVADFNKDGKLDIIAGEFIYLAPDWKAVRIREINSDVNEKGDGYAWDFMDAPLDVDGDGWLDVVTCSWHGQQMEWFRNPGAGGSGLWKGALVEKNGPFECGDLVDVDGDGKANEVLPATQHTFWAEVGTLPDGKRGLIVHRISDEPGAWRRLRRPQRRRPARHPAANPMVRSPQGHPQGPVEEAPAGRGQSRSEQGRPHATNPRLRRERRRAQRHRDQFRPSVRHLLVRADGRRHVQTAHHRQHVDAGP